MKAAQINKYGGYEVVEINLEGKTQEGVFPFQPAASRPASPFLGASGRGMKPTPLGGSGTPPQAAGYMKIINHSAPKPPVSPGKILIEVRAAGVNPIDWKIREGYLSQMAPLKFPATLGGDFSGVVAGVGEGVTDVKKGDAIFGQASILSGGSGSFAELALADDKTIAAKPKNIDHVEAAALPLAGVSALQALTEHIDLQNGQKILIQGGAGGIGTFAVQLAKHLGAYVAATASTKDREYVKRLGANEVIDYQTQSFENMLENYDAVFDTVGGETYVKSFRVLKKGGTIVSMVQEPRPELMQKHGVKAIMQATGVNHDRLSKLAELINRGTIKVHIDKTFSLPEAGAALQYLKEKHSRGKVVITVR